MNRLNRQSMLLGLFIVTLILTFGGGTHTVIGDQFDAELADWGDAPDGTIAPGYPTLAFNNGANHLIAGPWLGDGTDYPDAESDGQPDSNASGDDGDGNDDENGVSIPPLIVGQPVDITLEVGGGGVVQAWIDFDGDKTWQTSEQVFSGFLLPGTHIISFSVPDTAVLGKTFARFRISSEGNLSPEGTARDGEVEDYEILIGDGCRQPPGSTPAGLDFIRGDANQDSLVDAADATFILDYLFVGGPMPRCMDAADADDNGVIDLSDPIFILNHLAGSGPPPPPPFPDCGPDPTDDSLTCDTYDQCPAGGPVETWETKWIQLPDTTQYGIDIRVDANDGNIRTLADDFECRSRSLITDVHLWGSWKHDRKGVIKRIYLSIHRDDPAGLTGPDPDNSFSKPAPETLWARNFHQGQFEETLYHTVRDPGEWWWDPVTGELIEGGDTRIWRIDIDIDPNDAFLQQGSTDSPVIYWLEVQVDTEDGEFGWKTRRWPDHYMDDAVWDFGRELPRIWQELRYPKTHPYHSLDMNSIDMAFCLTYTPEAPEQPTSRPVSPTQCQIVETRCPAVETRCPSEETRCPTTVTRCPPSETRCPPAHTKCPPTETECQSVQTECPPLETECPPEETRCPPTETECQSVETECPPEETQCPAVETECSAVRITSCPPTETTCPALLTQCPVDETRCPPSQTKCPPTETECQSVQTRCPPLETECPPEETKCPPTETECQSIHTQCPPIETECTYEQTKCPPVQTECPAMDTECPTTETECPTEETRCPPVDTECPARRTVCRPIETFCPRIGTECPTSETRCPVEATTCPTILTHCPKEETRCPRVETECPPTETECPPVHTECPPTETECPPVETECPPKETECPYVKTECPPIETQCPNTPTECRSVQTECPPVKTECPPEKTICPRCILGASNQDEVVEAEHSVFTARCPAIEAPCPSIVTKQSQAKTWRSVGQNKTSEHRT